MSHLYDRHNVVSNHIPSTCHFKCKKVMQTIVKSYQIWFKLYFCSSFIRFWLVKDVPFMMRVSNGQWVIMQLWILGPVSQNSHTSTGHPFEMCVMKRMSVNLGLWLVCETVHPGRWTFYMYTVSSNYSLKFYSIWWHGCENSNFLLNWLRI